MGNCLKTQLKGSVNNGNLTHLGELVFDITPNGSVFSINLGYVSNSGEDVMLLDADRNILSTITWGKLLSINIDTTSLTTIKYVVIPNKYDIEALRITKTSDVQPVVLVDTNALKYCTNITVIDNGYINMFKEGANVSDLPMNINTISTQTTCPIVGEMSDILSLKSCTYLSMPSSGISPIDIKALSEVFYSDEYPSQLYLSLPKVSFNTDSYTLKPVLIKKEESNLTVKVDDVLVGTYNGSTWS